MKNGLHEFFDDYGINVNSISPTVQRMMNVENTQSKSVGGYLRTLYVQKGGSTTLPSEYFGKTSGSYFADVPSTSISDATPTVTRPALNETFKGGSNCKRKKYSFVTVSDLKKFSKFANKKDKDFVNEMLFKIYHGAIKNKKITVNSLKESFLRAR